MARTNQILNSYHLTVDNELFHLGVESIDFYDIDILVHLAAHSANVPYDSLDNCIYWNVSQPLHMFNSAKTAGVDKFIVTGSCFGMDYPG